METCIDRYSKIVIQSTKWLRIFEKRSLFIHFNSIVLNTERGMLIYITVASNRDRTHIMGLGQCKIMLLKIPPCRTIFTLWKSVNFPKKKEKKLHKIEFPAFSLLKDNMVFISASSFGKLIPLLDTTVT